MFDLDAARRDGYTDDEIASFLAPQLGFDLKRATADGWTAPEIVGHLATMKPAVKPPEAVADVAPAASDALGSVQAPPQEAPAAPLGATDATPALSAQDIADASTAGVYKAGAGLLDAFWAMGQSSERKRGEAGGGPVGSDIASDGGMIGPMVRGMQEVARILAPKDEQGRVKRTELATHLEDSSEALAPELQKQSFDDAAGKGHVLEWMVVQASSQSPQIATMLASVLFPPIAPVTLPTMGVTAAGNQYAENIKAGVPQDRAALDAAVNGLVEVASEGVGYGIGRGAGKAFERVLEKIPAEYRAAAASSIMARVAAGGATLAGAGVTEGASEAAGQFVQDVSQEAIAGRDAGDKAANMRTAFFASLLPGAVFAAPHTVAAAVDTPQARLERALDEAVRGGNWMDGSADAIARARLAPQQAQHTAATVPLDGSLDDQLSAILDAPVTKIAAPAGPVGPATSDLEDIGLSTGHAAVDFAQSFPPPLDAAGIAPEQNAQAHGEVIDAMRAARAEGNPEMYGHLLDAYRAAFGELSAQQLDQHVQQQEVSHERSDLRPNEDAEHRADSAAAAIATAPARDGAGGEAPARGAGAHAEEVGAARAPVVEGAAVAPANAPPQEAQQAATDRPAAGGASQLADVQGQQQQPGPREAAEDPNVEDFTTRRGEVKTFATKKLAELYRTSNRVPSNFSARKVARGEWRLSRRARSQEELERQRTQGKQRFREAARVRPTDSLATVIGKLGGIHPDELLLDGVDKESLRALRSGVVGRPTVSKKGMSLDGVAELLQQHGFDVLDENGAVDASKVRELIQQELDGTPVYTAEGMEMRAAQDQAERDLEDRAHAHPDFTDEELASAGFDELTPEAQDAVDVAMQEEDDDFSDIPGFDDEPGQPARKALTDAELDEIFGPVRGEAPQPGSRGASPRAESGEAPQGDAQEEDRGARPGVEPEDRYKRFYGRTVSIELPIEGGETATMTMRADEALRDIDQRIVAVESLLRCMA